MAKAAWLPAIFPQPTLPEEMKARYEGYNYRFGEKGIAGGTETINGTAYDSVTYGRYINQTAGMGVSLPIFYQALLGVPIGSSGAPGVFPVSWAECPNELPSVKELTISQKDLNGNDVPVYYREVDHPEPTTNKGLAVGRAKIKIRFTMTMKRDGSPTVSFGKAAPYNDFSASPAADLVESGGWTQGNYVDDEWRGTVDIPASLDGEPTFKIIASFWGGTNESGSINYIDSDENHLHYQPGPDIVNRPCVVILKSVTIDPSPTPGGNGKTFPITLEFGTKVQDVSVSSPAGVATIADSASLKTKFEGTIDLSQICLNGQKVCMEITAHGEHCASGSQRAFPVEGGVQVPNVSTPATLTSETTETPVTPAKYGASTLKTLHFTGPVMAVAVERTSYDVTDSEGNKATVSVWDATGQLEAESQNASGVSWDAHLSYEICKGKLVAKVEVPQVLKVTWEDACKGSGTGNASLQGDCSGQDPSLQCRCPGAYANHRESGQATIPISLSIEPGEAPAGTDAKLVTSIDPGSGIPNDKYEPFSSTNAAPLTPEVVGEPGADVVVKVKLHSPGTVKANILGVSGAYVTELAVDSTKTEWEITIHQDCSASGTGILKILASKNCGDEEYHIQFRAPSNSCTTVKHVYREGTLEEVQPGDVLKAGDKVTVVGTTNSSGGKFRTINGSETHDYPASPSIAVSTCRRKFAQTIAVKAGTTAIRGLDVGIIWTTVCDTGKIVNADPTFILPGADLGEAQRAALPSAYLSPQSSPGVQDVGVFANPFSGSARVTASIVNAQGAEVTELLADQVLADGVGISWDGKDGSGEYVPDGSYRLLVNGRLVESGASVGFQGVFVVDNTVPKGGFTRIEGMPLAGSPLTIVGNAADRNLEKYSLQAITSQGATLMIAEGVGSLRNSVLGILPPTVPVGSVLLRLTVSDLAGNTEVASRAFVLLQTSSLATLRVTVDALQGAQVPGTGQFFPDDPNVYVDEESNLPAGATLLPEAGWIWAQSGAGGAPKPVSGQQSHTSAPGVGHQVHYFIHADKQLVVDGLNNDMIIQYVYVTGDVREIMMQFFTGSGDGEHRAYWGTKDIQTTGVTGNASLVSMGGVPAAGQWVRLKIPVERLGLTGVPIKGIAYHVYGGNANAQVFWDKTTTALSEIDFAMDQAVFTPSANDDYTQWTLKFTPSRDDWLAVDITDPDNVVMERIFTATVTGGEQQVALWDGKRSNGDFVLNGIYYFQFRTRDGVQLDCDRLEPIFINHYEPLPTAAEIPSERSLGDGAGNTWELDTTNLENQRVLKRNAAGDIVSIFNRESLVDPLTPFAPSDLTFDPDGNVYVTDTLGHRLIKLSSEGTYLGETELGLPAPVASLLDTGRGDAGNLYVADASGVVQQVNVGRGVVIQSNIAADIVMPVEESLVRGKVPIIGTATARNFKQYTLTLSRTIDGQFVQEFVRSASEQVFSDSMLYDSPNTSWYGNLGTLDVGRDEYVYVTTGGPGGAPSESEGIQGVFTVTLKVDTLDGRSASDRTTIIVGRLISEMSGGEIEFDFPDGKCNVTVPSLSLEKEWEIIAGFEPADIGRDVGREFPFTGLLKMGTIVELRPPCLKFSNPATMTMTFDPADVAANNLFPTQLGIYAWSAESGKWTKLPKSKVNMSTGTVVAPVDQVSCADAIYGLFADPTPPQAPVVVQPASPTELPQVPVTVLADPDAHIQLWAKHESDAAYAMVGEADAGASGIAKIAGVPLKLGITELKAVAVDEAGNQGPFSGVVSVTRVPAILLTSLELRSQDFTRQTGTCCVDSGTVLGMEGISATPADPGVADVAVASVRSSVTDPVGLEVPLVETGLDTNVFRGVVTLGSATDPANLVLFAGKDGELVLAEGQGATWAQDSVAVRDETPPGAPTIASTTHPSFFQATLEDRLLGQLSAGEAGVSLFLDSSTASTGSVCVQAVDVAGGGGFLINLTSTLFLATDYPTLSFDYNMPAGAAPKISLWMETANPGRSLLSEWLFTETNIIYVHDFRGDEWGRWEIAGRYAATVGTIPNVVADGNWHHVELSLRNVAGDVPITRLFFANLGQYGFMRFGPAGENPPGAAIRLDNVLLTQAGSQLLSPTFSWNEVADPSGIAGYSVVLDDSPTTVPPATVNTTENQISFVPDDLRAFTKSELYVHVRAVDGAGNAGPPNHYRIRVDAQGPIASSPSPAPGSVSPPGVISVRLTDPGGSGIDVDGIRLRVNDVVFSSTSGGLTFDQVSGQVTFTMGKATVPTPTIVNGQTVYVTLEAAPDKAGNALQAPLSWSFVATFDSFARGQAVLLTISGGRQPAWSPDAKTVVYTKETGVGMKLFSISAADLLEKNGTVRQLTQNPTGQTVSDTHPGWSPSGNMVAFEREVGGQTDIYLLNLGNGTLTQLTDTTSSEHHPTWSPDGGTVYFERANDLWKVVVVPSVGAPELVRHDVQRLIRDPFWQYGTRLFYRDALYVDNIRFYDPGTGNEGELTEESTETQPSSSSSGQQVLFTSRREGGASQIWVMNSDGSQPRKLIDNPGGFSDSEPAFAPDGSAVVFESTRSGTPNLWLLLTLKLSPVLVQPPAIAPKAVGGPYTTATFTYTITADAIVTITAQGAGVTWTLAKDEFAPGGLSVFTWDGKLADGSFAPSGGYLVTVRAASPFGGDALVQGVILQVDNEPPVTTLPAAGLFVRQGAPQDAILADPGSGIKEFRVREGSNPFVIQKFTVPYNTVMHQGFALASLGVGADSEGPHSIQALCVDGVDNVESVKATSLIVDAYPPRIVFTPDGPVYEADGLRYARSSVRYSVGAFDDQAKVLGADSGLVWFFIPGVGGVNPSTVTLYTEGVHVISAQASDRAGWSTSTTYTVTVDDSPPVSTAGTSPTGVSNGSDVYVSLGAPGGPRITVAAVDGFSGVKMIETRLYGPDGTRADGLSGTIFAVTLGASYSQVITAEGRWRIEYRAQDQVGNVEQVRSFEVIATAKPLPGVLLSLIGPQFTDAAGRRYLAAEGGTSVTTVQIQGTNPAETALKYSIDGGDLTTVDRPAPGSPLQVGFTLAPGRHTVVYYGVQDTTEEAIGSAVLLADADVPSLSALTVVGTVFVDGAVTFVTSQRTTAQVVFSDPAIPGTSDPGSGLSTIQYSFNGGAKKNSTGTLSFSGLGSGDLSMLIEAADHVGNLFEQTRSFVLDDLPPMSSLTMNAEQYLRLADNRLFVTNPGLDPLRPVIADLAALDNAGGTGVDKLFYKLDGNSGGTDLQASLPYGDRMSVTVLTEGSHTLRYRANDRVGNLEAVKSFPFYLDRTPPTTVAWGQNPSCTAPGGVLYLGAFAGNQPAVSLQPTDGQGSGVKASYAATDGSTFVLTPAATLVGLPGEGTKSLAYFSVDHLGQYEAVQSPVIKVDLTPPTLSLEPAAGTPSVVLGGVTFLSPGGSVTASAVDPVLSDGSAGAGIGQVSIQVGTGPVVATSQSSLTVALAKAEGVYSVVANAKDRVENAAPKLLRAFTVDMTAPVTVLTPLGAYIDTGVVKYADVQTAYQLNATDVLANGNAGAGVQEITYKVMSGGTVVRPDTVVAGASALVSPLSAGTYTITWFAKDRVGNVESVRSLAVTVVGAGQVPTVQLIVAGPQADVGGAKYVRAAEATGASSISLQTVTGATSTHIRYQLDGGDVVTSAAPSVTLGTLPAGPHALVFRGVTIVGEVEAEETATVASLVADRHAPEASLLVADSRVPPSLTDDLGTPDTADDILIIRTGASLTVTVYDPVEGAAAGSGVDAVTVRVDAGLPYPLDGPLALQSGSHSVSTVSSDRIGLSSAQAFTVHVDGSAPATSVQPSGALVTSAKGLFASSSLSYQVLAQDLPTGAASGVDRILVRVDGAAEAVFASGSPISFSTDGTHTILHRAVDRLGNAGSYATFSVYVDSQPPTNLALSVVGPSYVDGSGCRYGAVSTSYGVGATDAGVGLSYIQIRVDDGTFALFSIPVGFGSEGPHTLAVKAFDLVGNVSPTAEFPLVTDATPPTSQLLVSSGPSHEEVGVLRVTSATKIRLSAADPIVTASVPGAGVKDIHFQIGAQSEQAYVAPFSVSESEGLYSLTFYSRDNVYNRETSQFRSVLVDNTPPDVPVVAFDASSGNVVLTWTANTEPDFAGYRVFRRLDGGNRVLLSGTSLIQATTLTDTEAAAVAFTTLTYEVEAVDVVANASAPGVATVEPSDLVPQLEIVANGAPLVDGWYFNTATVEIATHVRGATSPKAEVWHGDVLVASGTTPDFAASVADEGGYTVKLSAVRSGFTPFEQRTFTLDRTGPVLAITANGSPLVAGTSLKAPVLLEYSAQDPNLVSVTAALNGTAIPSGESITASGNYTLVVTANDRAGNVTVGTISFAVDGDAPSTRLLVGSPRFAVDPDAGTSAFEPYAGQQPLYLSASTGMLFDATDTGSGVATTEFRFGPTDSFMAYTFTPTGSSSQTQNAPVVLEYRSTDLVGNVEVVRTATLFVDTLAPSAPAVSVTGPEFIDAGGIRYGAALTTYALACGDAGSGLARIEVRQDQGSFEVYSDPVSFPAEGVHTLGAEATDRVGNATSEVEFPLVTDTTAPATAMAVVSGPSVPEGGVLRITSGTTIGFSASDPDVASVAGSGVKEVRFRVGELAEDTYEQPININLPDGQYPLEFYSRDNVTNQEATQIALVYVDNTAPAAPAGLSGFVQSPTSAILIWSPNTEADLARYRVFRDGVLLTADLIPQPGTDVVAFTDTEIPAGTMKASYAVVAVDTLGHVSASATAMVEFAGVCTIAEDPVTLPTYLRTIGSKGRELGDMRLPMDVAADASGRLYVADTQNHRIEVFNAQGGFLFSFGRHGKNEGNFNQPEAIAVEGNRVYVADRYNDRIQVFALDGTFLSAFGGHGSAPGQFIQPAGVALDGEGRI